MMQLENFCTWISKLAEDASTVACFKKLPDIVLKQLSNPERFYTYTLDDNSNHDVVLAVDVELPANSYDAVNFFYQIISRINPSGVLLLSVKNDNDVISKLIDGFLAHTDCVSICSKAELSELGWCCWLIQKVDAKVDIPPYAEKWFLHEGELMMQALNGDKNAISHLENHIFKPDIISDLYHRALVRLRQDFQLECTGWMEIKYTTNQLCLISGLISINSTGFCKKVRASGAGKTWIEASFLMICEGIERAAHVRNSVGTLIGTAFGFTYDEALLRSALEYLERFYFNEVFVSKVAPQRLNIDNCLQLSQLVDGLIPVNGIKKLYLLTRDEPFYIVLAYSVDCLGNEKTSYGYGLGCSFNILDAASKAIQETVQTSSYDEKINDDELSFMTSQGKDINTFLENLDYKSHFDFLDKGTLLDINSITNDSHKTSGEQLKQILKWMDKKGIVLKAENLLQNSSEDSCFVVRSICKGLPSEYLMLNSKDIPYCV